MDDMQEQQEIANEISDAISAPVGFGEMYDEDDLLAELEGMEQEDIDREVRILVRMSVYLCYAECNTTRNYARCRKWYVALANLGSSGRFSRLLLLSTW